MRFKDSLKIHLLKMINSCITSRFKSPSFFLTLKKIANNFCYSLNWIHECIFRQINQKFRILRKLAEVSTKLISFLIRERTKIKEFKLQIKFKIWEKILICLKKKNILILFWYYHFLQNNRWLHSKWRKRYISKYHIRIKR